MSKKKPKFDIFEHILVPNHIVLSTEEVERALKELNAARDQLPRIKVSDPALRNLEVKVGDVVKIVRESPTTGKSIAYRVVVE